MSYYSKAGIYIYFFPNGKTYVGQSVQLGRRLQRYKQEVKQGDKRPVICAIRKYGWKNIRIEYPFSIDRNSVNEIDLAIILDTLEMRYIKEYESTYPKGYNMTNGADGTLFTPVLTENIVNRLYNSDNSKPILLYDTNGNFMSEYKSIADCAYQLHLTEDEVRKYANCRKYMRGMYIVKLKKEDIIPESIVPYSVKQKKVVKEVIIEKVVEQVKVIKVQKVEEIIVYKNRVRCKKKSVLQYDLNGNFIKEWEHRYAIVSHFGKQVNIGVGFSSLGYKWIYKDGDIKQKIDIPSNSNTIIQCNLNGVKIAEYKSINEASIQTGIKYGRIYGIIQGTIKKPDYIWTCIA